MTWRVDVTGPEIDGQDQVLTPEALGLLADLHEQFSGRRRALLAARSQRAARLRAGERLDFLAETASIRDGVWRVEPPPADLADRRVEITGPTDRKMMINALNSGAKAYMADLEDSSTPSWDKMVNAQINLADAARRTLSFQQADGKFYELDHEIATLLVRPRGWHLDEKHVVFDGQQASASMVDVALYVFHNAGALAANDTGPYLYLPKLESHLEARLWEDVFAYIESALGLAHGTIRVTVLIETILAAFEMDEILFELRTRIVGLNAGRWDYIFSIIKNLRHDPAVILPDRDQITMTVPFMRAYTELLVKTCHRRGAHAIGGMAAFIPSRLDPEVTERAMAKVRADKEREAADGCDGTWVAHPGLVPLATEIFDDVLGDRPNQVDRQREDVVVTSDDLLTMHIAGSSITEAGLRTNLRVGVLYIESWLSGVGAAALFNLMEDAATAEISRSQVWQWISHGSRLDDGRTIDDELVRFLLKDEMDAIHQLVGEERFNNGRFDQARDLFVAVALENDFVEFLTLPASELID